MLSGHIHRHQVLTTDLARRPIRTPVLYPGSVERTSFAEMDQPKGFMVLRCADDHDVRWEFRQLPARSMIRGELVVDGMNEQVLTSAVRAIVAAAPTDAVVAIRVAGVLTDDIGEPSRRRACGRSCPSR